MRINEARIIAKAVKNGEGSDFSEDTLMTAFGKLDMSARKNWDAEDRLLSEAIMRYYDS